MQPWKLNDPSSTQEFRTFLWTSIFNFHGLVYRYFPSNVIVSVLKNPIYLKLHSDAPACFQALILTDSPNQTATCTKTPTRASHVLVCYTAVFSVVTQRSSPGPLRDDSKNGCLADYPRSRSFGSSRNPPQLGELTRDL